jgi:hypothetical protein
MTVEDFHGQSELAVKQELFAHFVLMTLTRFFSNHGEEGFNCHNRESKDREIKANFKNCLTTMGRNIEGLILYQTTLVRATINTVIVSIVSCRQKLRPNRSHDRHPRKPIGKWKPPQLAKAG